MALTVRGDGVTAGTHITFHYVGKTESGKTLRYEVRTVRPQREPLGWVYWYPAWRKYVYHPSPGTVYEETCLTEIAEFIAEKTDAHRQAPARPIPTCPRVDCVIAGVHHHDNNGPLNSRVK
jgi:hypothetical protein